MNTTGHTIQIPAHLIPNMMEDWGYGTSEDTDIHDVRPDGTKHSTTLDGYEMNDDDEIDVLRWQTHNTIGHVVTENVNDQTTITVWVPFITEDLAAEIA